MKKVLIISILVVVFLSANGGIMAQVSPLVSPQPPLPQIPDDIPICENCVCQDGCKEPKTGNNGWWARCNMVDGELDCCWACAWHDCHDPNYSPTAEPTPQPELQPAQPEFSVWYELDLWQGRYILLQNQYGEYCLPELAPCS